MDNLQKLEKSLKSLVDLGVQGHFPLFEPEWIKGLIKKGHKKITGKDRTITKNILKRMSRHTALDRKKTILLSVEQEERDSFVRTFISIVEGKILDDNPGLH